MAATVTTKDKISDLARVSFTVNNITARPSGSHFQAKTIPAKILGSNLAASLFLVPQTFQVNLFQTQTFSVSILDKVLMAKITLEARDIWSRPTVAWTTSTKARSWTPLKTSSARCEESNHRQMVRIVIQGVLPRYHWWHPSRYCMITISDSSMMIY